MMNTRSSLRISSRIASFNAWVNVMFLVCSAVWVMVHLPKVEML